MDVCPSSSRMLIILCLASACWGFSFGAGAPLASLWLEEAGRSDTIIGMNTGVYYLGIAAASIFVPGMMRRWGRGCIVAGMIGSGASVALFPWAGSLTFEFVLRAINGVGGAMSLIPTETLVNHAAPPSQRARNFGFYAFSIAVGISLGSLIGLHLHPFDAHLAFCVSGALAVLGGAVILRGLPRIEIPTERHDETPVRLRRHALSYCSAWCQGFLEGGMISLLPIYLLAAGFSEGGVSWMISGTMMGVILIQVPVAWLADRLGRTRILLGCYVVVVIGLACLPFCFDLVGLTTCLFLVGACSSAFYPLGLAILGEHATGSALAKLNAWYLAINCIGSLIGPILAGWAMDRFGKSALFTAGEIAVVVALVGSLAPRVVSSLFPNNAATEQPSELSASEPKAA